MDIPLSGGSRGDETTATMQPLSFRQSDVPVRASHRVEHIAMWDDADPSRICRMAFKCRPLVDLLLVGSAPSARGVVLPPSACRDDSRRPVVVLGSVLSPLRASQPCRLPRPPRAIRP